MKKYTLIEAGVILGLFTVGIAVSFAAGCTSKRKINYFPKRKTPTIAVLSKCIQF
jgi:hypothetical protein